LELRKASESLSWLCELVCELIFLRLGTMTLSEEISFMLWFFPINASLSITFRSVFGFSSDESLSKTPFWSLALLFFRWSSAAIWVSWIALTNWRTLCYLNLFDRLVRSNDSLAVRFKSWLSLSLRFWGDGLPPSGSERIGAMPRDSVTTSLWLLFSSVVAFAYLRVRLEPAAAFVAETFLRIFFPPYFAVLVLGSSKIVYEFSLFVTVPGWSIPLSSARLWSSLLPFGRPSDISCCMAPFCTWPVFAQTFAAFCWAFSFLLAAAASLLFWFAVLVVSIMIRTPEGEVLDSSPESYMGEDEQLLLWVPWRFMGTADETASFSPFVIYFFLAHWSHIKGKFSMSTISA